MARLRRTTIARHAHLAQPSRIRRLLVLLSVGLAVVLVAGLGVVGYTALDLARTYTAAAVAVEGESALPPDIGALEGGFTLFLTGTDLCEEKYRHLFPGRCDGPDAAAELNDVNMLVHVSAEPRRVTVVSFPRDLMIPIPSCTNPTTGSTTAAATKQPLYSAFQQGGVDGGLSCVVKTISQLSGQDVQGSAKVTWGGVIEITNAVGGVEVCLAEPVRDLRNTGIDWPAGLRTIQGVEALEFLRLRHGIGDGSDLGRISNQQQYMSRLARTLISGDVLGNPATLLRLAATAVANVTPSENLANPTLLAQIAMAVRGVSFDDIVFVQYPVTDDPADRNRVVPDREAAARLWAAIEANEPIELSGTPGRGVVEEQTGTPTAAPGPTSAPSATAPGAEASPSPTSTAAVLPDAVTGQTAAQQTCSAVQR